MCQLALGWENKRIQVHTDVIWTLKVSWLSDKAMLSGSNNAFHTFILARLS